MKVTISRREKRGLRRSFYIDCSVEFSEEEQAIIKARNLKRYGFTVDQSYRMPNDILAGFLRGVTPLLAVIGFVLMITSGGGPRGDLWGVLFFGSPIVWLTGWNMDRRGDKAAGRKEITVRRLLSSDTFTVFASDAGEAKRSEDNIHEHLARLKNEMVVLMDVSKSDTYEL